MDLLTQENAYLLGVEQGYRDHTVLLISKMISYMEGGVVDTQAVKDWEAGVFSAHGKSFRGYDDVVTSVRKAMEDRMEQAGTLARYRAQDTHERLSEHCYPAITVEDYMKLYENPHGELLIMADDGDFDHGKVVYCTTREECTTMVRSRSHMNTQYVSWNTCFYRYGMEN